MRPQSSSWRAAVGARLVVVAVCAFAVFAVGVVRASATVVALANPSSGSAALDARHGLASPSTNVVFNPGFEQGGCSSGTPYVCGWKSIDNFSTCGTGAGPCTSFAMYQDSENHSGQASMGLSWSTDFYTGWGWAGVEAATDPAFCVLIGAGAHPASFWYLATSAEQVSLGATFFQGSDCTGASSSDSFGDWTGSGWQQLTGSLVAPPGTQSALLSLSAAVIDCSYAGGCSVSADFDDVDVEDAVLATPVVKSFTPTSGAAGTSVDIVGANLTDATSVTFNGTAASFTVESDSKMHATVPAGATTGPISVTTPTGTGTSTDSFTFTPLAPTISSFTPTNGKAGTSVGIIGTRFTGATSVTFNGGPAGFTVVSDSEIRATVSCVASTGPISVSTSNGIGWSSSSFIVTHPPPTISSFTPATGPPGTRVDILGTNFSCGDSVKFNGAAAYFTTDSDSEIHATVPADATTGPISLTTQSGAGTSSNSFTVTPALPPKVMSFTPASGPVGTSVDIQGSNYTAATSVTFNGINALFRIDSDSEIQAIVPNGATTGPIAVTSPGGSGTSSDSFTVTPPPPFVTSFAPTSAPVGTSVDIHGYNFTGASSVSFNGTAAAFTVDSDTEIHATVPAGASTGTIVITTPGGTATGWPPFLVLANDDFSIAASPASLTVGHAGSGTSTINTAVTSDGSQTVSLSASGQPAGVLISFSPPSVNAGGSSTLTATVASATTPATYTITVTGTGSTATHTTTIALTVTAVNISPTASFTSSCTELTCSVDANGSSDPDGSIGGYAWTFGDGSSGSGRTATHTYTSAGSYTVTLTITDDTGATGTVSTTVALIGLSARGYTTRGREKVDLSWSGPSGTSFDVYRNDVTIATVEASAYTDNLNTKGPGSYVYKVCATAVSVCSNTVAVTF
jgi:hypothetical protein